MTRHSVLFFTLVAWTVSAFAQKENNIWYFGTRAGVDFNGTNPTALTDGQMIAPEGCATKSDKDGNLLFYTDGLTIWNRDHQVMEKDLDGHRSSTQSAVIVRKPESKTSYYVFTVSAQTTAEKYLKYTEVDMTLNGGKGGVTSNKNVLISQGGQEKIAATRHANGKDFWITTHIMPEDEFHSFLFTSSGVSKTPVVSAYGGGKTGYLKANIHGDKMAAAHWDSTASLYDFNSSTGKLSNQRLLTGFKGSTYGVEFSASGQYLYVSGRDGIAQFDISSGNRAAIQTSMQAVVDGLTVTALQMATNGKLYGATTYNYLCVINKPDDIASQSDFVLKAVDLGSANSKWGLPTFTNAVLSTFLFDQLCLGDSTKFTLTGGSTAIDSVLWDFGEPSSGTLNTSRTLEPWHRYTSEGSYDVTLILYHDEKSDTITKTVSILTGPEVDLGKDTTLCSGESLYLVIPSDTASYTYTWHDQSTDSSYTVSKAEQVWVSVTNGTCNRTDSIRVMYDQVSKPFLGNDTSLCQGELLRLSGDPDISYEWQNGAATQEFTVTVSGMYWLKQWRNSCSASDTINVDFMPRPNVDLGKDTFLCDLDPGFSVSIPSEPGVTYLWEDGSTELTRFFSNAGTYSIEARNADCATFDTLIVSHFDTPNVDLSLDTDSAFCIGLTVRLDAAINDARFIWHDNSSASFFDVEEGGMYWVEASNPCGSSSDTIEVAFKTCHCNLNVPNAFSPNQDFLNDRFKPFLECPVLEYRFSVYNRWGHRIFDTFEPGGYWDGTYGQKPCQNGMYFYTLELISIDRSRISKSGLIQVLR